ncbi:PucR family transcriptional regulator [Arthrobacter sp. 35W]|uniref:PucR family transcriptional regulator n=1 Tax=Arthrobacter sp. 35W TaxID=1132441 RepID=UPI00040B6BC9|nr:PucR family transcriptional regulator [Arthrobacter sp. 35W]
MSLAAPVGRDAALPTSLGRVTLADFLAALPAGPELVVDGALLASAADTTVGWMEPSELEDPTPYLLAGEVLLTAGLQFIGDGGSPERIDAYVQRLVEASVCALGFGIRPYFDDVPDALVDACRRHGLMLLRVPESVPFAALGMLYARLLETQNMRALRRISDATRALLRGALSDQPEGQVLEVLARHMPLWAVLAGSDGRPRHRAAAPGLVPGIGAPAAAGADPGRLRPLLDKLFAGSGPRIEVDSFDEPHSAVVTGYPLRSARDANIGALVIGMAEQPGPVERNIVEVAVGLLEALGRQRTGGALAPGQLATALLLHPQTAVAALGRGGGPAKDLLAQCTSSSRAAALRVVQGIRADASAPARAATGESGRELLQWRRIFDTKLVELTDFGFSAITRLKVDDAVIAEAERNGWLLAISDAAEPTELAAAHQRATAMRAQVRSSGRSIRVDAVAVSVAGLLGREAGTLLAQQLLAPLLEPDDEKVRAVLRVLNGWLEENGSWDAAAKALSLHRNSVRRLVGQAGELLGKDLADAGTRAELLIAMRFLDPSMLAPAAADHSA